MSTTTCGTLDREAALARLCAPGSGRALLEAPWRLDMPDGPYAVATDGKMLLAMRGLDLARTHDPDGTTLAIRDWIRVALESPGVTVEAGALVVFAGDPGWATAEPAQCSRCQGKMTISCRECDGAGDTTCDHCGSEVECERCEGQGVLDCPDCGGVQARDLDAAPRVGLVHGRRLNLIRLARIFDTAQATGSLRLVQDVEGPRRWSPGSLAIVGSAWVAVMMERRADPTEEVVTFENARDGDAA